MIKIRRAKSQEIIEIEYKLSSDATYEELSRPVVIKEIPETEEEMQMLVAKDRRIWEEEQEAIAFEEAFGDQTYKSYSHESFF